MPITVYVVDSHQDERAWVEAALIPAVGAVVFLEVESPLLMSLLQTPDSCLLTSADANEAATLHLVREIRSAGAGIPVIVLGPHTAFRTAIDIARLDATDFLERPVSVRQLRAAVCRACPGVK